MNEHDGAFRSMRRERLAAGPSPRRDADRREAAAFIAGESVSGGRLSMPTAGLKRVTLCVDDFGLQQGVNASVLALIALNRLGATGVLVDAPAARTGAAALLQAVANSKRRPAIGLHLNLTEAFSGNAAVAPGAETTRTRPLPLLIVASTLRFLGQEATQREIHRQCAAFEHLFGRSPDFVDGHQHVHQLPVVREALLTVLSARYGWHRPWIRSTRMPRGLVDRKARLIAALGESALRRLAERGGYRQNAHLLGVHGFSAEPAVYRERLVAWLGMASDGDLLMCHPSELCRQGDALLAERVAEHEVLTDAELDGELRQAGVVLAPLDTGHDIPA